MATRRQPQDHQQKKQPLQRSVPVVLVDGVLDDLEAAQAELAAAEGKAQQERDRLFHLTRTPGLSPAELLDLDRTIGEQVEAGLAPAREALAAAERAVRDATRIYMFRSIGRHKFRELIDEHPPREQDHAQQRADTGNEQARARWNDDTFPPALVLASCIDPVLTEDEVVEIWQTWNAAEIVDLFAAALAVNQQRRVVDLGKARG